MRGPTKEQAKMLLLFGAMTAMSGWAAALGSPFGYFGLLLFGGGGAVWWYIERAAGREPKAASRPAAHHGSLPGARRYTSARSGVVYPAQRGAMVAATLGSAIFVAAGVGMILVGGVAVGLLSVVVFGIFGLLGLRGVLVPGQGMALLPEGIYLRTPGGSAWLPWDAIGRAWVRTSYGQPSLAFRPARGEAFRLTGANRWLRRLNRRWFDMDVGYPAASLRADSREVCATVRRYVADPELRAGLADEDDATSSR